MPQHWGVTISPFLFSFYFCPPQHNHDNAVPGQRLPAKDWVWRSAGEKCSDTAPSTLGWDCWTVKKFCDSGSCYLWRTVIVIRILDPVTKAVD